MPLFETRDLAIYASVVGTLNGAWTLYHGVIRDRPRIVVRAYRGEAVPTGGVGARQELFMVTVSNRGRRPVSVEHVSRLQSIVRGTSIVTVDFMQELASNPDSMRANRGRSSTDGGAATGGAATRTATSRPLVGT